MNLKTQINESVKDAMKSGDEVRKRTLRMVLAAIKQTEVDQRSNPADKRTDVDDMAVIGLIQKEVKNRREAIEDAKKAERPDLIEENKAEIKVLEVFLPKAMPDDELKEIVQAAITETGAASMADMGKVMKIVMGKVAGRAPNDKISSFVRELLQKIG
ncbi:MAG TPA: GatB/YqeY domain-containing protein [Anaerolineales bacterium]|nr:GatB/YqeY domain-containing protein [Anaerolineales bacterium]